MTRRFRKLLAPALSLSFLAAAFTFDDHGIRWIWSERPVGAALVATAAAVAWAFALISLHARERPE